jgi:hypothetical protein
MMLVNKNQLCADCAKTVRLYGDRDGSIADVCANEHNPVDIVAIKHYVKSIFCQLKYIKKSTEERYDIFEDKIILIECPALYPSIRGFFQKIKFYGKKIIEDLKKYGIAI